MARQQICLLPKKTKAHSLTNLTANLQPDIVMYINTLHFIISVSFKVNIEHKTVL